MANKTRLRIITPDKTFFDDDVDFVIMRTSSGDVGILPGHIPLTTTIYYGVVFITIDDKEYRATLMGGFAEVLPDRITIVTDAAEWPHEIDKERAQKARSIAEEKLESASDRELLSAEISLKKALVRIEASSYVLDEYEKPKRIEQV